MKLFYTFLTLAVLIAPGLVAAEQQPSTIGFVNFRKCIEESDQGKSEQQSFDAIRRQMSEVVEKTQKELKDISAKLSDHEFVDGLSPKAEEDFKNKFQSLNQELESYQGQYYQMMNQANGRIIQTLGDSVAEASKKAAKAKNLNIVVNEESAFFYASALDITSLVVEEMNKSYVKNGGAASEDASGSAPAATPATSTETR